jgi:hypothetical protein
MTAVDAAEDRREHRPDQQGGRQPAEFQSGREQRRKPQQERPLHQPRLAGEQFRRRRCAFFHRGKSWRELRDDAGTRRRLETTSKPNRRSRTTREILAPVDGMPL